MSFLADSTWWILFLIANALAAVMSIRYFFRARLKDSLGGAGAAFLGLVPILAWLILGVVIGVRIGWLSAVVGLFASLIVGGIINSILRDRFPNDVRDGVVSDVDEEQMREQRMEERRRRVNR